MTQPRRDIPVGLIASGIIMTCALVAALAVGLREARETRAMAESRGTTASASPGRGIDAEPGAALPPFRLERARGGAFGREDLEGRVTVVDFFFTTCPTVCPAMSGKMQALQDRLADLDEIRLVSITVDPLQDDAAALRSYAERFGADPERWFFLRGEEAAIRALKHEGFGIGDPADPIMGHSTRFTLIDAEGRIRGYYHCADDGQPGEFEALVRDARELVARGGS